MSQDPDEIRNRRRAADDDFAAEDIARGEEEAVVEERTKTERPGLSVTEERRAVVVRRRRTFARDELRCIGAELAHVPVLRLGGRFERVGKGFRPDADPSPV